MSHNNLPRTLRLFLPCLAFLLALLSACSRPAPETSAANPPAPPTETVSSVELIKQADQLYVQREELARVREGVSLLRRARMAEAQNYEASWRLARLDYYLGSHTTDEKERDEAFREGVEAGEDAVRWQAGKAEGHFWLGANMGGRAESSSLSGLADAEDIRKEMETVIKLNEGFEGGAAYMVLGQVNLELPRLMGGDPQEAVRNLEKGLTFGADNALLRLHLAEAYLSTGRREDARKQLNTLLSMKPRPDYIPEHKDAVAQARKLLEEKFK
ncbi:MAG: tetratricopeptide repeat protein [Acidobacteria bacterium]|nr:tetratricopeptide repeat protein [Acidobacteriota bacterium]